jgi:hypothetical protein
MDTVIRGIGGADGLISGLEYSFGRILSVCGIA